MKIGGVSKIKVVIGIFAFIATIMIVVIKGLTSNLKNYTQVMQEINQTQLTDGSLNENVLKSLALDDDRDFLSNDVQMLRQTCTHLTTEKNLFLDDALKTQRLNDYCQAIETKLQLIEEFKLKNVVIKKSWNHLQIAMGEIIGTKIEDPTQIVYEEILLWSLFPSDGGFEKINRHMSKIEQFVKTNARLRSLFYDFHFHAGLILKGFLDRRQLENKMLSGSVKQASLSLLQYYTDQYSEKEKIASAYRFILLALCAILALFVLGLFINLAKKSRQLAGLNEDLENKVSSRTAELTEALAKLSTNQQMLTDSAKMSALGEMAGGVAHEINTPLAAIMLYVEMLLENAQEKNDSESAKTLTLIIRTVERIGKIVTGMRRFCRDSSQEVPTEMLLDDAVKDALSLCQERFKNLGVQLQVDALPESLTVLGVSGQISQVLLNLLNNSYDAIAALPEKWIRVQVALTFEKVELSVTDSGNGIPLSVQQKMMSPFFTTKEIGKGTGLGLSISKGILESHGGTLEYDAQSSHTRFLIRLPRVIAQGVAA